MLISFSPGIPNYLRIAEYLIPMVSAFKAFIAPYMLKIILPPESEPN